MLLNNKKLFLYEDQKGSHLHMSDTQQANKRGQIYFLTWKTSSRLSQKDIRQNM